MTVYSTGNNGDRNHQQAKTIAIYGDFGDGNFGNDGTLQAILYRIREELPEIEITCICTNPDTISAEYGLTAIPTDVRTEKGENRQKNRISRIIGRALMLIPHWTQTFRYVRKFDMVIVAGTGVIDDLGVGPFHLPYALFKWCMVTRLCKKKLFFVSIGAGPIHNPLSRLFMKSALAMADYRAYRSEGSKRYMQSIGFDAKNDCVYPDLAFSLPRRLLSTHPPTGQSPSVIGVGVMAYFGWEMSTVHGQDIYQCYIGKMVQFVVWLLEQGYTVRLLIGDVWDQIAVEDIVRGVDQYQQKWDKTQLLADYPNSVEQVLEQISTTDLVVATRFHNIIFALMLSKPVISIGYSTKNDLLLAEMGLAEYCQEIERLDVAHLKVQFTQATKKWPPSTEYIQRKNEEYRLALDEQYASIFRSHLESRQL